MRPRGQLQEDALLLQDESLAAGEFVVCLAGGIGCQPGPVGLISRQAVDVVGGIGRGGRAFMRREIAYQVGTAARNGLVPVAGVFLERRLAERVDLVTDETGDSLFCLLGCRCINGSRTVETSCAPMC